MTRSTHARVDQSAEERNDEDVKRKFRRVNGHRGQGSVCRHGLQSFFCVQGRAYYMHSMFTAFSAFSIFTENTQPRVDNASAQNRLDRTLCFGVSPVPKIELPV